MKKVLFMSAIAAAALASCTSDEYVGQVGQTLTESINFGTSAQRTTRATSTGAEAAEKLNNNFIVYGFKTTTAEDADMPVFDLYNVNYTEGTANTTESNTANWEYVGLANHDGSINPQTIKYWDYSQDKYVFSAVSGTGITATKTLSATPVYDKGWTVSIPAGGSLSDLYASDRKEVAKTDYKKQVDLTFRALGTKIRFAMYETIPGYSVKINNLYYDNLSTANGTNFAIDGKFVTTSSTAPTTLTITYNDGTNNTVENTPKVTYSTSGDGAAVSADYMFFGANIQAAEAIGTTSVEATYDDADKAYTMILPVTTGNEMKLMVDYTLTATDKETGAETIEVKHATAIVPANFNIWKPNFAYTYIFKISDNTNGTTGTVGSDPAGLYPITFDAVVVTTETDVQETITSVSDPSITTYQNGEIVTKNDEYVAGIIYFENDTKNVSTYGVYEVNNYGDIENITEEVVANWKNNFCVLTPVWAKISVASENDGKFIPLADGTFLVKGDNEAGYFHAAAGKTYVIASGDINAATTQYKVVKVAGDLAAAPAYTQAMTTASITTDAGNAVYTLKSNSPEANTAVLGATACLKIFKGAEDVTTNFTITDNSNGTYTIALTPAAIAAGADGTYTVKFNDVACAQTFNVNLHYALRDITSNTINVVAGNKNTFKVTIHNVAPAVPVTNAVIVNDNKGITIEETATPGTYQVSVAADKANGSYKATIAGQALTINVNSYSFSAPTLTITRKLSGNNTGTITLNENGVAKSGISLITSPALASGTTVAESAGVYTYTVTDVSEGGVYNISYENASAKVIVNAYTITAKDASIAAPTGSTTLTVTKNGKEIPATVGKVLVTATIGGSDVVPTVGTQYTLTTNGSKLIFKPVVAGSYNFTYCEDGEQVAVATVVAN